MQIVSCIKLWIPSNLIRPQNRFYRKTGDVTRQHVIARLVEFLGNREMLVSSGSIHLSGKLKLRSPFASWHCSRPCRLPLGQTPCLFFDFGLFFEDAAVVVGHYFHKAAELVVPVG